MSPYAAAKVCAHHYARVYRESYGMHISCGILFNHESPRRGETFVTRKITKAAARIWLGKQDKLHLGELKTRRDWGFAGDYTKAMVRMMERGLDDDLVIATGEMHSVKEFLECAFSHLKLDPYKYLVIDERLKRPNDLPDLCGDYTKASMEMGWEPTTTFGDLVKMMVDADLEQESDR
jgi:GDPmannose 4,6-dehydratase